MKIKVKYEVDDGYLGGSRPHYIQVDTEDYEGASEEDIINDLEEAIQEHFLTNSNFIFSIPKELKPEGKK